MTNQAKPTDREPIPSSAPEQIGPPEFPPYRDGSVDAGLWALAQVSRNGVRYSLYEIAFVCGCSAEWVRQIEERAIKKMRDRLRRKIEIWDPSQLTRENTL